MIYLDAEDLQADSFQRFITDSTKDDVGVIDRAELKCIGIMKTYLQGRYDVDLIFDEDEPIRDEVFVEILVKLVLKKIFGRNAARKVPTDVKEDYDEAMKQLEKLNAGRLTIKNLPVPSTDDGSPSAAPLFGNISNPDFYI